MPGTIVDTGATAANQTTKKKKKKVFAIREGDLKCWAYTEYLMGGKGE